METSNHRQVWGRGRKLVFEGNGRMVKFWKDLWCEDQMLKVAFPNLFWLAIKKDEWVFDAWEKGSSRHFNDWEMEEVEGLFRKTAFFGFEYRCGGCLKLEE